MRLQNRTMIILFDRFFVTSPLLIDDTVVVDNYISNISPGEPKIVWKVSKVSMNSYSIYTLKLDIRDQIIM